MAALAGGYGNIGYMGPGLALATLGPDAAVPVALIFCFDTILLFTLDAVADGIRRRAETAGAGDDARRRKADRAPSVHHRDVLRRPVGGASTSSRRSRSTG